MKYTPSQLKSRARTVAKYKINGRPMTLDDYNSRLAESKGGCNICGRLPTNRSLAVDHSHLTGEARGVICYNCNRRILGWLERLRVDPRKIVAYFERYDPNYLANVCRK